MLLIIGILNPRNRRIKRLHIGYLNPRKSVVKMAHYQLLQIRRNSATFLGKKSPEFDSRLSLQIGI